MKVVIDKSDRLLRAPQALMGSMRITEKLLKRRGLEYIDLDSVVPELPDYQPFIEKLKQSGLHDVTVADNAEIISLKESLALMEKGMDTSGLITHIGGLDAVPEATLNLPNIPGGKKLIYTHLEMPLAAITDFRKLGEENPLFIDLADICDHHDGLWSVEAEELLLKEG